jgi:hypothetical protein
VAYFGPTGAAITSEAALCVDPGNARLFLGQTGSFSSNAGIQASYTTANRAQFRGNQFGVNAAGAGVTGFKSRGASVGALAGCIASDLLWRATAIGVTPDNVNVPLAGTISIQVPASFVAVAQNYLPSEVEIATVPMAGPINGRRTAQLVTADGETQTLRGVRAGGAATLPTALGTGSLWSSGAGTPNGSVNGNPGDLYTDTNGGAGATLYVKESGTGTNTGWTPK